MRDIISSVSAQTEEIVKTIRSATARLARAEHVAECAEYTLGILDKHGPFSDEMDRAVALLRESVIEWRARASN